ncbi:MAG: hypothetical protein RSD36_07075 [Terrisporobacter sp.]
MSKNILLLNGSTRVKGNSLTICNSLRKSMLDKGAEVEIENIQEYFNNNSVENLEMKFNNADIIGIVAPLYVDGFPYPVIAFLEEIQEKFSELLKGKSLFMVGQCNFPQSIRIKPMILSCQCFAKELEMKFLGGMSYGGSVVRIEGRSLEEAGKEGKRMIKALDMAVDDIINDKEISKVSNDLFKNDFNSLFLRPFAVAANIMFKEAKKKHMESSNK